MDRRKFLATAALIGAGAALGIRSGANRGRFGKSSGGEVASILSEDVPGEVLLAEIAARKGLLYGAAANRASLESDPAFASLFARQCAILVPEYEMKWSRLSARPGVYDFGSADWLAAFARRHRMKLRGHTLVWHSALPAWFQEVVTKGNAERVLIDHVTRVGKHFSGQIHSWDVVNEAVQVEDGRNDGLRNSPWLELIGPAYIEIAFHAAAEADPHARLAINEFGLDYASRYGRTKRRAVLRLLERLIGNGVPVHALGIQAHLRPGRNRFDPGELQKFLTDVAGLGLEIFITEMDVRDHFLPGPVSQRDEAVAEAYGEYLSAVLEVPAVTAVLTWGISDRYTWLRSREGREDGLPLRPLLFDDELQPKPAWHAVARAIQAATPRGGTGAGRRQGATRLDREPQQPRLEV